jgi:hypothetical protein
VIRGSNKSENILASRGPGRKARAKDPQHTSKVKSENQNQKENIAYFTNRSAMRSSNIYI